MNRQDATYEDGHPRKREILERERKERRGGFVERGVTGVSEVSGVEGSPADESERRP